MPVLNVMSWNAEWMNDWFNPGSGPAAFRPTFNKDGVANDTATTAQRAADLITALDPDLLALQEAPSRPEELALFIDTYLAPGGQPIYASLMGDSGGAQKLAFLYKPAAVTNATLAPHGTITQLIDPWEADVNGDALLEPYEFTRLPLVVDVTVGGDTLQLIMSHTKSSYVNNGKQLWQNPGTRQQYVVAALEARRRNAVECLRMRNHIEIQLDQNPAARILVVGDLNDGPGRDYFEDFYLAHSITDILIGSAFAPEREFAHAQHDVAPAQRFTAVFDDFVPTLQPNRALLLDHMLLSPGLMGAVGLRKGGPGEIAHGPYENLLVAGGNRRENRPSDHRPVLVPLQY